MGYKEEAQILHEEMMKKRIALHYEGLNAYKDGLIQGLESSFSAKESAVTREFNRKLKELKEKYNID